MDGYLVRLRIVRRSHEHYGLTLWIGQGDGGLLGSAKDANQAGRNAAELARRAAQPAGMVTVESVRAVTVGDRRKWGGASIRIQLAEDRVIEIRADAEAWARAYRRALDNNTMIEVHGSDGRTLGINPHQILFWEEAPDESGQDSPKSCPVSGSSRGTGRQKVGPVPFPRV
jgi:hypothetical protein